MKIPRDLSGTELIKKLEFFGYSIIQQTDNHIRLNTMQNRKHNVTVPNHSNLRMEDYLLLSMKLQYILENQKKKY